MITFLFLRYSQLIHKSRCSLTKEKWLPICNRQQEISVSIHSIDLQYFYSLSTFRFFFLIDIVPNHSVTLRKKVTELKRRNYSRLSWEQIWKPPPSGSILTSFINSRCLSLYCFSCFCHQGHTLHTPAEEINPDASSRLTNFNHTSFPLHC